MVSRIAVRRCLPVLAALIAALLLTATARAGEPGPITGHWEPVDSGLAAGSHWSDPAPAGFRAWQESAALVAGQPATSCDTLLFDAPPDEIDLVGTDADIVAESDGSRLCLFYDERWDSYVAATLSGRTLEEFRRTKETFQPLLTRAGIDPCRVAFWTAADTRVAGQISLSDRHDAGQVCPVEVISHGPQSERRVREVEDSIAASAMTAEQVFDWTLTWPLRVHMYDNQEAFIQGVRTEAGDDSATARSLQGVRGGTGTLANGGFGYLINISRFPETADLRMLVAHEFAHVAQAGLLGDPDVLPFFVIEGGAEYFASLVVGADQEDLAHRFREAVNNELSQRAVPLRDLVQRPPLSDERRTDASYSRGYAAIRYLTEQWGLDSFSRLHDENIDGNPTRFLEAMSRLTGLSLDDFDRELAAHLLNQGATATMVIGRLTLQPGSAIADAITARPAGSTALEETGRFSPADASATVIVLFNCLQETMDGEAVVIAPDGQPFATFTGDAGPGCGAERRIRIPLDVPANGRTAHSQPGTWRVEIHTDGVLQGTITFVVE